MMSRLFQNVAVGTWTQISVILFLAVFMVILGWVYLPFRKSMYDEASKLPLQGGEDE